MMLYLVAFVNFAIGIWALIQLSLNDILIMPRWLIVGYFILGLIAIYAENYYKNDEVIK